MNLGRGMNRERSNAVIVSPNASRTLRRYHSKSKHTSDASWMFKRYYSNAKRTWDAQNQKKSTGFTTIFMEMSIKHKKYQVLPPSDTQNVKKAQVLQHFSWKCQ